MKIKKALGALALCFVVSQANAAVVILSSVNVDFEFDDSLFGLFGSFGVEDDTLELHEPAQFLAQTGAFGVVSVSQATSNIEIIAHPGFKVVGVSMFEAGEYFRLGSAAMVAVGGQFIVGDTPWAFSSGNLDHTTRFEDFHTSPWEIAMSVTTDSDEVNVKLVNDLVAGILAPDVAQFASIRKTRVEIAALTAPVTTVPLPASVWMLGSSLLGYWSVARHRSRDSAAAGA